MSADWPKHDNGDIDRDAVKAMFMTSKHLDWYQFCDEHGVNGRNARSQFPVSAWVREKRDFVADKQMEILAGLIHDRKFKWTNEIIKTLDDYLPAIDMGLMLTKAKMSQIADWAKDYQENFRGKEEKMFYRARRNNNKLRRYHPFEKLTGGEIAAISGALNMLTNARLKALMLDKLTLARLDEHGKPGEAVEGAKSVGPMFTIEGKEVVDAEDLQTWFDRWHDKRPEAPEHVKEEAPKPTLVSPGESTDRP